MPVFEPASRRRIGSEQIAHIAEAARQIRIQDLKLVHYAGAGHIGGDFSAIDILATLYGAVLNVTPETVDDPERDRFILSKGHIAGALYTTLAAFGFIAGRGAGHLPQAAVQAQRPPEPATRCAASRPIPARSVTACRSRSATPSRPSWTSPAAARTCWSGTASCRRAATGRR